jgi:hypothetical protein
MTTPAPPGGGSGSGGPPMIVPLVALGLGGYFLWFGIHYWRSTTAGGGIMWPSDPIKSALQGKGLPSQVPATTATAELTSFETSLAASAAAQAGSQGGGGPTGTGQSKGSTTAGGRGSGGGGTTTGLSGNKAIVNKVAALYGWGSGAQWQDLVNVINRESGFNNTAQNPTSTAYGIFQFLDSTWATVGARKTSSAQGQAIAGMKYIKQRYGSPAGAWAHEQKFGWY